MLSWIFTVLGNWNNSPRIDMLPHSDILSLFHFYCLWFDLIRARTHNLPHSRQSCHRYNWFNKWIWVHLVWILVYIIPIILIFFAHDIKWQCITDQLFYSFSLPDEPSSTNPNITSTLHSHLTEISKDNYSNQWQKAYHDVHHEQKAVHKNHQKVNVYKSFKVLLL